jgi:hypothetical protein
MESCEFIDAENISRLRECLKGKALDAVKYLLLAPENVPAILMERRWIYNEIWAGFRPILVAGSSGALL